MPATAPLIDIRDLRIEFTTYEGQFTAVDGIDLAIARGRTLGLVGESGCGKSVTSLAIMRLLATPPARVAAGSIRFDGTDLLQLSDEQMRAIRGRDIAMIFQEPMTSLNPAFRVGDQIAEGILRHRDVSAAEAKREAIALMKRVGIPAPERRAQDYPHKLSGGMRQRVMIAMALACRPKLLIADEPTTALDVTIQAQILELLRKLRAESGMGILLITHDLGVIAEMAHEVAVMYSGRIVERAAVKDLFATPQHPYTIGLLGSIPSIGGGEERLAAIEGMVPNPMRPPSGCRFNPRCPFAIERCRAEAPPLAEVTPGHHAACWRAPLDVHVPAEAVSA
jgi:oligopeptide/dipeptide ABC transporter ATP-binding protein